MVTFKSEDKMRANSHHGPHNDKHRSIKNSRISYNVEEKSVFITQQTHHSNKIILQSHPIFQVLVFTSSNYTHFKMRFFAEIVPMALLLIGAAQAADPKANEYKSTDW